MCIRTNLPNTKWPASVWDSSMWNPGRWCGLRITRLIRRNPRLSSPRCPAKRARYIVPLQRSRKSRFPAPLGMTDRLLVWGGGGPVGEGHGPASTHHGWDDVLEAFVISRRIIELELRAEFDVKIMQRFDAADQPFAREIFPRALQSFDHDHCIDEAFEADEVGRIVGREFTHRAAVECDGFQIGEVIGRDDLRNDHAFGVLACEFDEVVGADERDGEEQR